MKARKFVMLMASVGLVFGLMTGCGGGSSDGGVSPAPAPAPEVGLEPEKVNDFIGDMADELGCTYTEITTSQSTQPNIMLSLKTAKFINKVIINEKNARDASAPVISGTEPGTCGGTITMPDSGLIGDIVFTNYCMQDSATGERVILNGSVRIEADEATETIIASTPTPLNITSTNPNTGQPEDLTIDLDRGTLVIHEDGSMKIDITKLIITDNVTHKTYTITNFTADIGEDMITFSGTLDNPEVTGAVDAVGSINTTTGEGTVTITDQNGDKIILTTTAAEGVFDVSFNNAPLGKMDCSMVAIPEV